MNCPEFLNAFAGSEPLSPEAAEHARGCAACRAASERTRHLKEGLRSLADEWRRLEAPSRVERALVSAYRGHTGLTGARPAVPWMTALTLAAAAALLLALALFLMQARQPGPQPHRGSGAELALLKPGELEAGEVEAEFIPLPNASQLDAGDPADLVRVELPRSAMIALGYSVTADRAEEPVEADVVLGPDGLARAVRFVDEF